LLEWRQVIEIIVYTQRERERERETKHGDKREGEKRKESKESFADRKDKLCRISACCFAEQ
jgi:hypothetical protein